jgi:hypothetical protein
VIEKHTGILDAGIVSGIMTGNRNERRVMTVAFTKKTTTKPAAKRGWTR